MICPNCKSKMRVSHPKTDHTGTYRTRRCKCGYRMETLEASVEAYDRQALQRYEDRTRKVLAEIAELVRSVQPVTPRRNR